MIRCYSCGKVEMPSYPPNPNTTKTNIYGIPVGIGKAAVTKPDKT